MGGTAHGGLKASSQSQLLTVLEVTTACINVCVNSARPSQYAAAGGKAATVVDEKVSTAFVDDLQAVLQRYSELWEGRDESANPHQARRGLLL